jgi:hypothetical protein
MKDNIVVIGHSKSQYKDRPNLFKLFGLPNNHEQEELWIRAVKREKKWHKVGTK